MTILFQFKWNLLLKNHLNINMIRIFNQENPFFVYFVLWD